MAERCYGCQLQFGLLQRRHNCVICGASVCEKCSSRDLIVYVPDEDAMEAVSSAAVAKLAVVRVVGVCDDWMFLFFDTNFQNLFGDSYNYNMK